MPSLAAEEDGEQGEQGEHEEGALVTGGTHEDLGDLSVFVTGTLEGFELGVLEVMLDCNSICCREANGKFGGYRASLEAGS